MEAHAPLKTKTISECPRVPWYSSEIKRNKSFRRKAEKKWRTRKLPNDLQLFRTAKNYTNFLMTEARTKFYTDFVNENSYNAGKLFRAARKLLFGGRKLSFSDYQDKNLLADDVGNFFIQKITRIQNGPKPIDNGHFVNISPPPPIPARFTSFKPATDQDVLCLISTSGKKSYSLDPMPTALLVLCIE